MKIKPRKYFLGISLLSPDCSWSSWFSSSSDCFLLKLRTLSAVSEAARGHVRMELKAAPGTWNVIIWYLWNLEWFFQIQFTYYLHLPHLVPIKPREKMTTPNVPRNWKIKSPSWLMEKALVAPSWWNPDPTIRIKIDTETADPVENAIPLWADLSSRPLAMDPPRKRL